MLPKNPKLCSLLQKRLGLRGQRNPGPPRLLRFPIPPSRSIQGCAASRAETAAFLPASAQALEGLWMCFPQLPPALRLFSGRLLLSQEAGLIPPLPPAPFSCSSAAVLCHPGRANTSPCQLLPVERDVVEGTAAESWQSRYCVVGVAVGRGGGAWSQATCPLLLQSWKSQASKDQTLHMKVRLHQLQLSRHLFSGPGPSALQMGARPPS